jgi:hypothetical protein
MAMNLFGSTPFTYTLQDEGIDLTRLCCRDPKLGLLDLDPSQVGVGNHPRRREGGGLFSRLGTGPV